MTAAFLKNSICVVAYDTWLLVKKMFTNVLWQHIYVKHVPMTLRQLVRYLIFF